MQVRVKRQNITDYELEKALTGYIMQEGLTYGIVERLSKSDEHEDEPIPEKYIQYIYDKTKKEFKMLLPRLSRNVDKLIALFSKKQTGLFTPKIEDKPPFLTQDQLDELRMLIESHFKQLIGIDLNIPKDIQRKWNKIGIEKPTEDIEKWLVDSYIAGRVYDTVDNNSSYIQMIKEAKKVPLSRLDQLTIEASKQNAAKYIKGYGKKLADIAEDVMVQNHKSSIQEVIQSYFTGDLKHTHYNDSGFTPKEVEQVLSTDKGVKGWKELSTELKNRFKAVDVGRDWDRVAVSEIRFATNLGRIMNIQVEGGGDPEDIEVYYHVQSMACKYCKQMYLNDDGTPKIFKLSEILNNIQETGGMQIGLKAGLIGESGGWVPNALCHPFGHCYPVRKMKDYPIIPIGGKLS